jgi:hypothetical protein
MCHKLEMAAWDYRGADIGPIQRLILVRLCRFASPDGGLAYPSMDFMSEETSVCLTTLKKTFHYLREHGFMSLVSKAGDDKKTNVHKINFEKLGLSYNDLYSCKKSPTDLSPKIVDNFKGGVATRPPTGRETTPRGRHTTPQGSPHDPNKQLNTYKDILKTYASENVSSVDNVGDEKKPVDHEKILSMLTGESKQIFSALCAIGVDYKSRTLWVKNLGLERVNSMLRDVLQAKRENPSHIKNLGGYLRHEINRIMDVNQSAVM